ncbi:hypothetical protein COU57_06220 [Candidatus Pacearchaeota archaeon CG10_big_fil_rev_8_21_14_0_10_32_14]|nr:MAG: hypothetical protein COU57_06220 [Candidatus Pacearchaeota archaeon CG10_big_fil_rev_8_21_14_0_10_32_14]
MSEYDLYLKEIILMIERIQNSTNNYTKESFSKNIDLIDATLMRLHFIGETIKSIPYNLKKNNKEVRWKRYSKLRDIIGHKYSQINLNIIWDVVQNLTELDNQLKQILDKS